MTPYIRGWVAAPAAALLLLFLPSPSSAQTAPTTDSSSSAGLSAPQRARAQARQQQFQKEVTDLRADPKLTDAQKKAKYGTLLQAMDRDMLAILTPAQRTEVMQQRQIGAQFQKDVAALKADPKLTDAQKQAKYQMLVQQANQRAMATLPPAQRALAMKRSQAAASAKQLGQALQKSLTPAQEKQVHAIGLATGTQVQTVVADKSLSQQAKVARITTLREQAQTKINALLTPTQRDTYSRIQALAKQASAQ